MANDEHLDLLYQGVASWNQSRKADRDGTTDLLTGATSGLSTRGSLRSMDLSRIQLPGRSFRGIDFSSTDLSGCDLSSTDLRSADLSGARFDSTYLANADLSYCTMGGTILARMDLRTVKGLDTIKHIGPSTIGIDTVYQSGGDISEVFLRGTGIPDEFATYMKSLVVSPIQYYSCFISYSSKDNDFAQRLYADLQREHIRCWFAPEDLSIGDKFRSCIDEAILVYDKLLLVLSDNSARSAWVESEVEAALEKERRQKHLVLFPIRLDETVMMTAQAWASEIRRTRHIGDFSMWKQHDSYSKAFDRLVRDLRTAESVTSESRTH